MCVCVSERASESKGFCVPYATAASVNLSKDGTLVKSLIGVIFMIYAHMQVHKNI